MNSGSKDELVVGASVSEEEMCSMVELDVTVPAKLVLLDSGISVEFGSVEIVEVTKSDVDSVGSIVDERS